VNISKREQRVLHALAQGGHVVRRRDERGRTTGLDCFTRDGWRLPDLSPPLFRRLRQRGFVASSGGGPYRITRQGIAAVRAQLDNR